ncbi:hypothetical protein SAMN05443572_102793 [Myxococcus fulvus]|uniref:Outer membrane protein beta-barrel domain-containing protein n=1 Tax=Myxococcus fulvus TaxID=33 RepID=A0A511SW13_MYXFU|nr:hypothetical protein [Myxococcus fulvus]GEN06094.1 hypothetical protein MFU01_11310 [Myxococcus fulvus]SET58733.1 hypothetical protein SAMN05443572_102793 [Myxococcus fulvus]
MHLARIASLCLLLSPVVAAARNVTVPVDVGVGPAAFLFFGPVFDDQPIHTGLKLSVEAVLDKDWLKKNQRAIPSRYRKYAKSVDEVRISPSIFIPDSLIISPKVRDTGMYGITWKPLGLGLPLTSGPVRLAVGGGVLLTYAYLHSDTLADTHFVRPGAELGVDLELQLSKSFLISLGWESALYVPQELGGLGLPDRVRDGIFHVGQAYLQFHVRFPYSTRL